MYYRSVLFVMILSLAHSSSFASAPQIQKAQLLAVDIQAEVLDLTNGKIISLKREAFQSQKAYNNAISEKGDIWYNSIGVMYLVINSKNGCDLTGMDLRELAGKDLSEYLKNANSIKIEVGSILLIQTRKKNFALLQVIEANGSLSIQWLYQDDGKAIFPEIPFQDLTTPKVVEVPPVEAALAAGRELTATRKNYIEHVLFCLQAVEARKPRHKKPEEYMTWYPWQDDETDEDYNPGALGRAILAGQLYWPCHYDFLKDLRAVEGTRTALKHPDATTIRRSEKSEDAVKLLKVIGRPASALIVDQLNKEPNMPEHKRRQLLDLLDKIEGPVADVILNNPPPLPPEPILVPKKGTLKVQFTSLPWIKLPFDPKKDNKTVFRFSTREFLDGPVVTDKKWKLDKEDIPLQERIKLDDELLKMLTREVEKKGDIALCLLDVLTTICSSSSRHVSLGWGPFAKWDNRDLAEFLPPKRLKVNVQEGDDLGSVFLMETVDKKYVLFQLLGDCDANGNSAAMQADPRMQIAYVYQPNGTARFDLGPIPTPVEILDKRPHVPEDVIWGYLTWIDRQFDYYEQVKKAEPGLKDILSGKIPGATLEQKAQALRLLGELREFRAAELMIDYLDVQFPVDKDNAQHPAVWALVQIQPAARPALLDAIAKAKNERERKVLIDALIAVETKPAAEKLLGIKLSSDAAPENEAIVVEEIPAIRKNKIKPWLVAGVIILILGTIVILYRVRKRKKQF